MTKADSESGVTDQMTRRSVLKGAAAASALAVAPAFLAACGGGGGGTTSGSGSTAAATAETVGGSLAYLGWQGEDFPSVLAPWRKQNGVTMESNFFAEPRDVIAKYTNNAVQADILCGSSTSIPGWLEGGVPLMPLDTSRIPNYGGLSKFFQENEVFYNEAGDLVAVPFAWSAMGISFDSSWP